MTTTGGFTRTPETLQRQTVDDFGAAVDAEGGASVMADSTIAETAPRRD